MFCCYFAGAFYFSMRQKGAAQTAHGKIRGTKNKETLTFNVDEFEKSRIHQVFSISCFINNICRNTILLNCQTLNTKYKALS